MTQTTTLGTATPVPAVVCERLQDRKLYRLDPPAVREDGTVATHALVVAVDLGGESSFAVPANEHGVIVDYLPLEGSEIEALSYGESLRGAGYEVAS